MEFLDVEAVTADHGAIEQQNGDIESVPAQKLRIAVDVHDLDGREALAATKRIQLSQHLIAEIASVAMHHGQFKGG
ncbi:MAG TPA: hypothetical protein VFB37_07930 [Steroidobacteraceae bacterium]|nr:hypothetical protein [Steroidobacteraceae bacterium]